MRVRTAAVAALGVSAALAAGQAALAAPVQHSRPAGAASPSFTNPGAVSPSLSASVSPSGEPEVASVGKNGSLWFTCKTGSKWHRVEVAKSGAESAPSMIAEAGGTALIAVEGPDHKLLYYFNTGGPWSHTQVAGKGSAYSAPSLAVGPTGPGIAVQGPANSLVYFSLGSGHWHKHLVNGKGIAFSAPSLVIRDSDQKTASDRAGQVDIAVQNGGHSLSYYNSLPNGHWQNDVFANGNVFSAPSLIVFAGLSLPSPLQGTPLIAVEGPSHTLWLYINAGAGFIGEEREGKRWVYSAPSLAQGDSATQDLVAFQNSGHSMTMTYLDNPDRTWVNDPVAFGLTTYSAPSLAFRTAHPAGEIDIVIQGPGNSLRYYHAPAPKPSFVPGFTSIKIAGSGTTFGG